MTQMSLLLGGWLSWKEVVRFQLGFEACVGVGWQAHLLEIKAFQEKRLMGREAGRNGMFGRCLEDDSPWFVTWGWRKDERYIIKPSRGRYQAKATHAWHSRQGPEAMCQRLHLPKPEANELRRRRTWE